MVQQMSGYLRVKEKWKKIISKIISGSKILWFSVPSGELQLSKGSAASVLVQTSITES